MSTRSAIIERLADGSYRGIYCHFDGYEEGVGSQLLLHYRNPETVSRLIDLGDISILGERIDPIGPHSFDKREDGTTVAYERDRGETWARIKPKTGATWQEVAEQIGHNGYAYVFQDGGWLLNGEVFQPRTVVV